jgi:hypothetical protein
MLSLSHRPPPCKPATTRNFLSNTKVWLLQYISNPKQPDLGQLLRCTQLPECCATPFPATGRIACMVHPPGAQQTGATSARPAAQPPSWRPSPAITHLRQHRLDVMPARPPVQQVAGGAAPCTSAAQPLPPALSAQPAGSRNEKTHMRHLLASACTAALILSVAARVMLNACAALA